MINSFFRKIIQSNSGDGGTSFSAETMNFHINGSTPLMKDIAAEFKSYQDNTLKIFIVGPTKQDYTDQYSYDLKAYLYEKLSELTLNYKLIVTIKCELVSKAYDLELIEKLSKQHLVILIPSSPGSFCLSELIATKCADGKLTPQNIITIYDKKYAHSKGYINNVLMSKLKELGARTIEDYYKNKAQILKKLQEDCIQTQINNIERCK